MGYDLNADPVVKAVLTGLAAASIVTWTVWLAKTIEIFFAKRRVRTALNKLIHVRSTAEGAERLADSRGEVIRFLDAGVTELKVSPGSTDREGIKERVASRLERIEASYGRRILRGTGVLATIGATAPFVGLFGNRLGYHEQLHRHLEVAYHQPRGGRAGHRRGAAGDRIWACGRHSRRGDLQCVRALDRGLPR
jgi:biopolymer transport protein ExbB